MKVNDGKWKEMEGYKMKWKDYISRMFFRIGFFLQTKLKQHIVNRD